MFGSEKIQNEESKKEARKERRKNKDWKEKKDGRKEGVESTNECREGRSCERNGDVEMTERMNDSRKKGLK